MTTSSRHSLSQLPNASPVPDLIYAVYRDRRIAELGSLLEGAPFPPMPSRLHRITLFTTYRCQLDCVYCKTIRKTQYAYPAKGKELDLDGFKRILALLSRTTVRHIHFTGGEATLVADLPEMVSLASGQGIVCSTTSNGISHPDVYDRLVKAGMSEIRISLDSHCPDEFDRMVRMPGAYSRVVETIRFLVRMRDRIGNRPFVIVNMCVGPQNRRFLSEFVEKSLLLKPNDVKLITMVQARSSLGDFPDKDRHIEAISNLLDTMPTSEFPLLRYKMQTVFASDGLGLNDITSRQLMRNCFIPITERTLDTTYYYPCSVYLREGGTPLGRIDEDDFETQQKKIYRFVYESDCKEDPICQEYCINCCRKFNQFANWRINNSVGMHDGATAPIRKRVELDEPISNTDIDNTLESLRTARRQPTVPGPHEPFLVIKPSGLQQKAFIFDRLRQERIEIREERWIADWNDVAMKIYIVSLTRENVIRGLMLKQALPIVDGTCNALMLIVKHDIRPDMLKIFKKRLHDDLCPDHCLIRLGDTIVITRMTYIHTPDPEKQADEYGILCKSSVPLPIPSREQRKRGFLE